MSALEEAWLHYGGQELGPHHGWQKTLCVLHDERRPSAVVNLETGKWRCYAGCGRGDIYDLVGVKENLDEFRDQKEFCVQQGWYEDDEDSTPEPTAMNPNPKPRTRKTKRPWKPPWL